MCAAGTRCAIKKVKILRNAFRPNHRLHPTFIVPVSTVHIPITISAAMAMTITNTFAARGGTRGANNNFYCCTRCGRVYGLRIGASCRDVISMTETDKTVAWNKPLDISPS